jgi:hypothetical protein
MAMAAIKNRGLSKAKVIADKQISKHRLVVS